MFTKIISSIAIFIATIGFAFAQVDVNKADQAALDGVKGIGPKTSKSILDERKKGGEFKDWADLERRVKGIGDKNSVRLSQAGLTVNGQARQDSPAIVAKETKKTLKADVKIAKADAKDARKDADEIRKDLKKEEPKK